MLNKIPHGVIGMYNPDNIAETIMAQPDAVIDLMADGYVPLNAIKYIAQHPAVAEEPKNYARFLAMLKYMAQIRVNGTGKHIVPEGFADEGLRDKAMAYCEGLVDAFASGMPETLEDLLNPDQRKMLATMVALARGK